MELESIPLLIQNMAAASQIAREAYRANRAEDAAYDAQIANATNRAAASTHAKVASDLRVRLIGAEAEIARLQNLVDDLAHERSNLITAASDLLDENERLRSLLH